eukprot:3247515-Pleurochrysis_carterae.AAC.3
MSYSFCCFSRSTSASLMIWLSFVVCTQTTKQMVQATLPRQNAAAARPGCVSFLLLELRSKGCVWEDGDGRESKEGIACGILTNRGAGTWTERLGKKAMCMQAARDIVMCRQRMALEQVRRSTQPEGPRR